MEMAWKIEVGLSGGEDYCLGDLDADDEKEAQEAGSMKERVARLHFLGVTDRICEGCATRPRPPGRL